MFGNACAGIRGIGHIAGDVLMRAAAILALLLAVSLTACQSPMNKTTKWAGVISGGGGGCISFSIEMTIDKDGGIVGEAAHHATGTVWDVSGMVDKSNFVNIRIEDIGDVARSRAVGKLPWLTLAGHLTGSSLSIAQPSSRSCDPPRSGVLKRL